MRVIRDSPTKCRSACECYSAFVSPVYPDALDGDLRGPALVAYVAQGGVAEWEAVLAKVSGAASSKDGKDEEAKDNNKSDSEENGGAEEEEEEDLMAEQKLQFIFALAAAPSAELQDRALELCREDLVRGQDLPSYLGCCRLWSGSLAVVIRGCSWRLSIFGMFAFCSKHTKRCQRFAFGPPPICSLSVGSPVHNHAP